MNLYHYKALSHRLALSLFVVSLLLAASLLAASPCKATPYFSAQTGWSCTACHENPEGGAGLTAKGYRFRASGYVAEGSPATWRSLTELIAGFLHILTAVIWFGAIFYIHIFVGPRSLTSGVPKNERILGLGSLIVVGLTGLLLTWLRLDEFRQLWTTSFGIVLLVKIGAFLSMVAIAVITNTYVHRALQKAGKRKDGSSESQSGAASYLVYQGERYEISGSKLWKGGVHMGRHRAGIDLTEEIEGAPHGEEVLERLPKLGPIQEQQGPQPVFAHKLLVVMAYVVLGLMFIILFCLAYWNWGPPLVHAREPWTKDQTAACIGCHQKATPAIYADWARSRHAHSKVTCLQCHSAQPHDGDMSQAHFAHYKGPGNQWAAGRYRVAVSALVTPRDCSRCHQHEPKQFARSKHAHTLEIIGKRSPWLSAGLTQPIERSTGCERCHGSVLQKPLADNSMPRGWPNTGIGRVNLDGSKGFCSACHGRHCFSLAEARKAEACGHCHVGPAHPQMEIWQESKHGAIARSEGSDWNWGSPASAWTAGLDYRTPTCAACHMSGSGSVLASHNTSERLSWELQAPLSVRPNEFAAFPSELDWRTERGKMQQICLRCHSESWVLAHYRQLDGAVQTYNNAYYLPAKATLDALYSKGALAPDHFYRSPLWWVDFYELWHHYGRQARMGAAMMAPDYAWWHGFYECKKQFVKFQGAAYKQMATDSGS